MIRPCQDPGRARRRLRGDAGSATLWVTFCVVIVIAVAGLVFDGGQLVSGREQAVDRAEQAARAGTQATDPTARYGDDQAQVTAAQAQAKARAFAASNGWTATVSGDAETVTVTVTQPVRMTFLNLFGVGDRQVSGTSTSRVQRGHAGF